ncbi:serine/threonine protein kinase [Acanthopleuribacter pedis]|uniref:Serine/threonine protein kinase n=1 Tax=Acanthopleuribacter pedis TaxID=442870 RepID=A0A8J7U653_9BACT|nr:serine/threonine-protein kinase [Acanthopleuribacter pedis]MBO1322412.1 serine/threonine protein kinase [Acanthopleuribacter pedis]
MPRVDAEASRDNVLDKALFNWDEGGLDPKPGETVGRYQIVRKLGEDGMGVVYLARQAEPIEREIALKLIRAGMDSRQVAARFRLEQHTLAKLKHPYIAHVYDGGISEQGRPWFAMEYIEGTPISDWCDKHRETIEQRLRLFLRLCETVHHAHRRGCLHRDLKPTNILVCEEEGVAAPKVIDFGIAKATTGEPNPNRS